MVGFVNVFDGEDHVDHPDYEQEMDFQNTGLLHHVVNRNPLQFENDQFRRIQAETRDRRR